MSPEIGEIKDKVDAEKLSELILKSLVEAETAFNPFRGRLIERDDGTILFMGDKLSPEAAVQRIAHHIWENRKRINKQIKKWNIGGDLTYGNCGC